MDEQKTYSGLRKALHAIGGDDPVGKMADCCEVGRRTVLGWLRADGAVFHAAPQNRVREAAQKAGGTAQLARALGVSHQAVSEWIKLGYAPPKRAQEIELQYGIPRTELVSPRMRSVMGIGGEL